TPRHRELAERPLVAQRIAILQLDNSIVEGRASVELDQARAAPQRVVTIAAGGCEGHFILAPRQAQRIARRSVDRREVQWLVHWIRLRGGRLLRPPSDVLSCIGGRDI